MKYIQLLKAIDSASRQFSGRVATVANQALVLRNWLVGSWLVEYEQDGADRARYGARLLESVAADAAKRGLQGLDVRSLRDCRLLFQTIPRFGGHCPPNCPRPSPRNSRCNFRGANCRSFATFIQKDRARIEAITQKTKYGLS